MFKKLFAALIIPLAASVSYPSQSFDPSLILDATNQYDRYFREHGETYLPFIDWKLFKAQCYAESTLKTNVVSHADAKGICQLLETTFNRQMQKQGFPQHQLQIFDADQNIEASAIYMLWLWTNWSAPRPATDRHKLSLASYNAGIGYLLEAQKLCGMKSRYHEIIACLHQVPRVDHEEPIEYVKRIYASWMYLKFFG